MAVNTDSYRKKTWSSITIASDTIAPNQELVTLTSESSTSDNLATISVANFPQLTDASISFLPSVVLRAVAGHTITVQHNIGNIMLYGAADIALSGDKVLELLYNGTSWVDIGGQGAGGGGGGGTVTSVALAAPSDLFTIAGSPVTASGTLTLNKTATTPANQVYASPDASTGAAAFRALVSADIPNLDAGKITSGQLALARGGTAADLSATGGTGQVLKQTSVGGAVTVGVLADSEIPNLPASKITSGTFGEARGGTNQSTYATGDLLYASAADTLAKRAIGTTGQVLTVVGGVPAWAAVTASGGVKQVLRYEYDITATGYSTTSTSFVDVDATNLATTITTTGGSSTVIAWASFSGGANAGANSAFFDLILGSTRANTSTFCNRYFNNTGSDGVMFPFNIFGRWTGLSAATHTVKLQYRATSTAFISRDATNAFRQSVFSIILMEI
jgi:hypothetical protein